MKYTQRVSMLLLVVVFISSGCAITARQQLRDARVVASHTRVEIDRKEVAISSGDIPVFVDRSSIRAWLPQGRGSYNHADDVNSEDSLFAVARELINQTNGLRVYIPAGVQRSAAVPDRRSSRRGLQQYQPRSEIVMPTYDEIRMADGRVPFWFGVVASEALRRNSGRSFRRDRDSRDGGSAWVAVTVELRAPVDGGWVTVASGTGDQGWRKFLILSPSMWGIPYDPVYRSTGEVMIKAYGDMVESLNLAPWAEVSRSK